MEIYISINGVLRNLIQKFEYQYQKHFLETDLDVNQHQFIDDNDEIKTIVIDEPPYEYGIKYPIQNKNLTDFFNFQTNEEYEYFTFIEYPLEIFGYAGISYATSISDLNRLIYYNPEHNITIVGMDELGKSKSSTLFFLSKNGFLGNNIKFIKSDEIDKEWEKCDAWITDDEKIITKAPKNKISIKFNTDYNKYFVAKNEINNLTKIDLLCLK